MKKTVFILLCLCCVSFSAKATESVIVRSPKGELTIKMSNEDSRVFIEVLKRGELLFEVRDIFLETSLGEVPKQGTAIRSVVEKKVNEFVVPQIKEKAGKIANQYTEATVSFKDKSALIVRVYDNGVAYRIRTAFDKEMVVNKESARFVFSEEDVLTYQQDTNRHSSSEEPYVTKMISTIGEKTMGNLPALVEKKNGNSILIAESDVQNYPAMWLKSEGKDLGAYFWNYPKSLNGKESYYNKGYVAATENFIAKTAGKRDFPWRVFAIEDAAMGMLSNELVYLLAPECKIADPSWIKPGWVMFDWWARYQIYNVDFKSGLNTESAKHMIDFSADFGIPYFLVDDYWFADNNLTTPIREMNIPEIMAHAKQKNVDVMLWIPYSLFDEQMEETCKKYAEWGVKGVKIDFLNRSDQKAVEFCRRAAEVCAKYNMVIDFHGVFAPNGLRREYPNVLTREGLIEFEFNGWTDFDSPDHHCTLPFVRNVVGPMDYIPATTNNATKAEFRTNGNRPMGQGTRAHAMALAVIGYSPMQMLSDGPTDYYRESETSRFVTSIPTEWDEVKPIDGKPGDYVTLARRNGNDWYVAAITDWTPREKTIALDFLAPDTEYEIEIFKDGANAATRGIDYKREVRTVKKGDVVPVGLSAGGGWIAKITAKK